MKKVRLKDKSFQLFIDSKELNDSIESLSNKINQDYSDREPIFLCVLNGAFVFAAELIKRFNHECQVSFVKLSSYQGVQSSGTINSLIGLNEDIKEKDVIIVEDIVDTGQTIANIVENILNKNPRSIEVATLLYKPKSYQKQIPIKYRAIEIGNDFIVGFGLDYNGLGRNLEEIYIIEK
mgnify:FL=1|tara:strand:+ start:264 stop:800 length:537 start_codon:yes stop_codon:yes gene_type:complete